MKKTLVVFFLTGIVILFIAFAVQADIETITLQNELDECPRAMDLEETPIVYKEEFLKALESLIPETYTKDEQYGDYYSKWNIITATPLPLTMDSDENDVYYEIAKNLCGKEVANKSWLVLLHFPNWDDVSAGNAEGEIFLAKSKEKGWYVWYRYH